MSDTFEKIVYENTDKNYQYRLTVSSYKDTDYVHLRKYFQSYEGDWIPSSEGASFPVSIQSVFSLLDGLIELVSMAETSDVINKYFSTKLSELNNRVR